MVKSVSLKAARMVLFYALMQNLKLRSKDVTRLQRIVYQAFGLVVLFAAVSFGQSATTGDRLAWDYPDASASLVSTFKICDVRLGTCSPVPVAAARFTPKGTAADPLPAAGFSSYGIPLPAAMTTGSYTVTVQACDAVNVCTTSQQLTFAFVSTALGAPTRLRVVPK